MKIKVRVRVRVRARVGVRITVTVRVGAGGHAGWHAIRRHTGGLGARVAADGGGGGRVTRRWGVVRRRWGVVRRRWGVVRGRDDGEVADSELADEGCGLGRILAEVEAEGGGNRPVV